MCVSMIFKGCFLERRCILQLLLEFSNNAFGVPAVQNTPLNFKEPFLSGVSVPVTVYNPVMVILRTVQRTYSASSLQSSGSP